MASRNLDDLRPEVRVLADTFLGLADRAGLDVLVYCTLREFDEQARLYRQGRPLSKILDKAEELDRDYGRPDLAGVLMDVGPQSGRRIVTWAGPGQSLHNYGYALDGCPLYAGKPVWSPVDVEATPDVDEAELWMRYGTLAQEARLEWAGNWPKGKREYPHLQAPGVSWRDLIRGGA